MLTACLKDSCSSSLNGTVKRELDNDLRVLSLILGARIRIGVKREPKVNLSTEPRKL